VYKIGEFSRLAQVSVRMLRHYDKLGLLTPSEIDQWTGYRYYTIDQLPRLNRILALNGMGFTLQQVSDLLIDPETLSAERMRGMLMVRQAELEQELQEKRMQIASVEARLRQIELEDDPLPYEVIVKSVEKLPVASVRQLVPTIDQVGYYCDRLYERLYGSLAKMKIEPLAPEVTLYHADEFTETDLDVEMAVAVEAEAVEENPHDEYIRFGWLPAADEVATLAFEGLYEEIPAAILPLLGWVGAQEFTLAGPLREVHLSGPAHVGGVLQEPAVLELQMPVARKGA
jgi:DNA-binding transcriptional MerR regulator